MDYIAMKQKTRKLWPKEKKSKKATKAYLEDGFSIRRKLEVKFNAWQFLEVQYNTPIHLVQGK